MAQKCRDRGAAIGESRHGPETHTPVRMMVRPAISFLLSPGLDAQWGDMNDGVCSGPQI